MHQKLHCRGLQAALLLLYHSSLQFKQAHVAWQRKNVMFVFFGL
jgi:hypothetical protein